MLELENQFGQNPVEYDINTTAARIGMRMRKIRTEKGITLSEFAEKVKLTKDRISKYEHGARKPRPDMVKRLADALEVSPLALGDHNTTTYIGAMYALFELQDQFHLILEERMDEGGPAISLTATFDNAIYDCLKDWYAVYEECRTKLEKTSDEEELKEIALEYDDWKWNYPQGNVRKTKVSLEKMQLRKQIDELLRKYEEME